MLRHSFEKHLSLRSRNELIQTSNQAMERTADRRTLHFEMISTFHSEQRALPSAVAHLGLVRPMHRALVFFAFVGVATAAEPPGSHIKQPNWDRATFAMYTNGQPKFQVSSVRRNGDELFADLSFSNSTYEKRILPPVTIRGVQLSDGSFWPYVTLQVGDSTDGPWKEIGRSHQPGKRSSVTIPPTLMSAPLRVDFLPFLPFLHRNKLGRVVLPNGDAALFELKDLRG